MRKVVLEWYELSVGVHVGGLRRALSLKAGRKERFAPGQGTPWRDINGACAEIAVAKWRNLYWPGHVDVFHVPDVGGRIAVKHTHYEDGCLIVREDEPDENFVALVTGMPPNMDIVGYLLAGEAKQRGPLKTCHGSTAHWVPQSELIAVT